jgi:hypothetical protein
MKRAILVLAALAAAACDQPPVKEIAAAEQQVERARIERADRYAPERYNQAVAALETARTRLRERNYRAALSAANDAAESARVAVETTGPAKAAARKEIDVAVVEVTTMLERAATERDAAVKAGVPKGTLAPIAARAEHASARLAELRKMLANANPDFAAAILGELRTEVTPLPDMFRDARTSWEAKRPKSRAKTPARRPSR